MTNRDFHLLRSIWDGLTLKEQNDLITAPDAGWFASSRGGGGHVYYFKVETNGDGRYRVLGSKTQDFEDCCVIVHGDRNQ